MDPANVSRLLRSLVTSPSRRAVARALTGCTLAGALPPLLDLTDIDAKRNKKKRRRRKKRRKKEAQPFCAGKNRCVDGAVVTRCDDGSGQSTCHCFVTADTGESVCAVGDQAADCLACTGDFICIDGTGAECFDVPTACAFPCPNPL